VNKEGKGWSAEGESQEEVARATTLCRVFWECEHLGFGAQIPRDKDKGIYNTASSRACL